MLFSGCKHSFVELHSLRRTSRYGKSCAAPDMLRDVVDLFVAVSTASGSVCSSASRSETLQRRAAARHGTAVSVPRFRRRCPTHAIAVVRTRPRQRSHRSRPAATDGRRRELDDGGGTNAAGAPPPHPAAASVSVELFVDR